MTEGPALQPDPAGALRKIGRLRVLVHDIGRVGADRRKRLITEAEGLLRDLHDDVTGRCASQD